MLCDHSGNYGRLERGRTEQGSEKMTIAKRLYTGVMPDKTASRLIKRIKKRKPCADVYVITLPLFEDGLLEVYEANEFLQPYYKKRTDDIVIVGMSMTKAGAFFLIRSNLKYQLLRDLTSACRRAMKSGRPSTLCSPERVRTEMVSFSASLSPRTSMYGIFWLCASRIL